MPGISFISHFRLVFIIFPRRYAFRHFRKHKTAEIVIATIHSLLVYLRISIRLSITCVAISQHLKIFTIRSVEVTTISTDHD